MAPADLNKNQVPQFSQRPRRRIPVFSILLVLLVLCFAGPYFYINFTSNHALQRVIDETNRSDPNWQLLELEAQRAVIPDEQNSAINLMNARRLMPPNWPRWDFAEESDTKNLSPDELEELRENFLKVTPTVQLNAQQVAALRKELKRASAALAELYQIADKPRGRYPITYAKGRSCSRRRPANRCS